MQNTNLDEKKPREFWIKPAYKPEDEDRISFCKVPRTDFEHVIEYRAFADQQKKIEKLENQLEVCRVALEFYGNESKYEKFINVSLPPSIKNRERIEVILDNGKRARQTLDEVDELLKPSETNADNERVD